ncbi:MAG: NADPH-dependent FMN reductase [Flavobacteriales bacterium]
MQQIAIILGSTRPQRKGEAVAKWVLEHASERHDALFTLIDLREVDLPFLDEGIPPSHGRYQHEHTKRWAKTIARFDGFILVTPEYNHGTSAVLKNALDFLYGEWNNKAAGFVSYGGMSGARAVEQLRQVMAELQVATVRAQVGFALARDFKDGKFTPADGHEKELTTMLDQLVAWSAAMRQVRLPTGGEVESGIPGFHHVVGPDGRVMARMEPDADSTDRADTGTGDQPGNIGDDRFMTSSHPKKQER